MYLKRIEIKGFKSFADPVVLEFGQGLNAIVGPNGSGKSNIIEAVRWVLGEQSAKQLRGDKMQDIIFNGTSQRRAMNFASVLIVIDNKEHHLPVAYDEVTIMRQLSRDGESRYELNGSSCRLKDIHDLFTDSGIGKESLSIISQGKIEAIFDVKPENRRQLFEEAAGVLKYKQRKGQTEKKLKETDEHLDRLEDILYELNEQLTPLKAQSETYLKYEMFNEQLKNATIKQLIGQLRQTKEQVTHLTKEIEQQNQTYVQCQTKMTALQEKEATVAKEKQQCLTEEKQMQEKQLAIVKKEEQVRFNIDLFHEKERHQEENQKERQKQLLMIDSDLMSTVEKKVTLAEKKKELTQKVKQLTKQEESLMKKLQQLTDSSHLSAYEIRDHYFSVMQKSAQLNNDFQALQNDYLRVSAKKERTEAEGEQFATTTQHLLQEQQKYEEKRTQCHKELKEQEQRLATIEANYRLLKEKAQTKEAQHKQAEKQLTQLQASIDSLTELLKRRSLYFQGPREVLATKKLQGIVGSVIDVIDVKQEYVTAIDTALSSSGQSIIVKTERDAKEGIAFLKNEKKGQATFLPQETIRPAKLDETRIAMLQNEPGFIGVASDLVTVEKENQAIIASLLGTTVIATTLEAATQLAKKGHYKVKIITLEGDIVQRGGALTGGSRQNKGSLLQQKETLAEKEKQYKEYKETYKKFQYKLQQLQTELQQSKEEKEKQAVVCQTCRIHFQQADKLWQAAKEEYTSFEKKHCQMSLTAEEEKVLAIFSKQKKQYEKEKASLEQESIRLQELMKNTDLQAQERQQKEKAYLEEKYQLQQACELAKQALQQQNKEYRDCVEEERKLQARKETLLAYNEEQETLMDIADLEKELQQITKQKEALLQQQQGNKARLVQLNQSLATIVNEKEELQQAIHQAEVLYVQQKEKQTQCNEQLDQWLGILADDYHLTYEAALQKYGEGATTYKAEINELQKEIKSLGPVNMEAKRQFDEVNERYQVMKTQHQDVLDAKSQLLMTIGEMDMEVKHRFKQTFDAISASFSQLFPQMFGGGSAELILTQPEDLLQTGIEINVQPPGKKVKALSLLSGGEKALTAITLLFAIIKVRPVPFCILDEVEAALDEVNVTRFSHYLKHVEKRQFIVVTHRKGTMEMADALYGVTMENAGVSKIVSVKLEDIDD